MEINKTSQNEPLQRILEKTTGNIELRRMVWNADGGNGEGTYGSPEKLFCRDLGKIERFINNGPGDVFHGVATRKLGAETGTKNDIYEIVCLHVDVDFKTTSSEGFEVALKNFCHQPTIIINSGNGRHLYWFLKVPILLNGDARQVDMIEAINRGLGKHFSGDHTHNIDRVLRTPGRPNSKWSDHPLCRIISANGREYDLDELEIYADGQKSSQGARIHLDDIPDELPAKFRRLLAKNRRIQKTWKGERRDIEDQSGSGYDMAMANLLVSFKFSAKEIACILLHMPSGKGKDATREYLKHTISKALASSSTNGSDSSQSQKSGGPYRVENGCIVRERQTQEGPIVNPLCNFTATVTEEITLDDGAETTRTFLIEGQLEKGTPLLSARVPSSQFGSMSWVTREWGLHAIVHAGQANKDYLREAIQALSPNARSRRVFQHTGWRGLDGQWVYLTTGGAVGQLGVEVDLGPELSRYQLPREIVDPVDAMRTSLKLLEIAPLYITAPLWAGVFRAPLANAFPVDLSLWLEGMTGTLKSTLAALFLCHYGEFDRIHLPGTWSSTANQLERRAFLLKDILFVVDDYVPGLMDRREVETKASRLLRSQGNLAGRGRLRADLSERPTYSPRGLILSTGEQHPPGQSLLARTLVIRIERGHVNMDSLSEAQKLSSRLPHAMAGYISWLGPQMSDMPSQLKELFEGTRTKATKDGNHLRIPEVLAHLWLGYDCALTYAEEIGACSKAEAEDLRAKGWGAFLQLGTAQGQLVEEERPTLKFLRVLSTLITQGRVTLLRKNELGEEDEDDSDDDLGQGTGKGDLIGWRDDDNLYLIPEASFKAVSRFCQEMGEPLPTRLERLRKDLSEEKISECDQGRLTATVWIGSKSKRVLRLKIAAINGLLGEDFPL